MLFIITKTENLTKFFEKYGFKRDCGIWYSTQKPMHKNFDSGKAGGDA